MPHAHAGHDTTYRCFLVIAVIERAAIYTSRPSRARINNINVNRYSPDRPREYKCCFDIGFCRPRELPAHTFAYHE